MTTTVTSDRAPAAIALLGAAGTVERATAMFLDRYGADDTHLATHQSDVDQIVAGQLNQRTVMLDGVASDISAVLGSDGRRYALLMIPVPAEEADADRANPLLDEPIDESSAIVWLKDLDGRYMRVNRRYGEQLSTDAEHVCGKTDAELSPSESIEGLRLRGKDLGGQEPLELEYTVAAFDDRPAFAVLRFALRDGDGQPIAVCGVAAPVPDIRLARSECERLMKIERWGRLDESAIREELLDEWGLAPANGASSETSPERPSNGLWTYGGVEQLAAIAAERDAALATSASLDQQLGELRDSLAEEQARLAEEQARLGKEQARRAELEQSLPELEQQRSRAEEAEAALEALRSELLSSRKEPGAPSWDPASQRALSAALAGVSEWRAALKEVVNTVGLEGGWDAAVAWCPDDRRGLMKCVAMWTGDGAGLGTFETRTWQHRQDVSGTEFGRARNRAVPTGLLELQTAEDALLRAAAEEGIGSAVLVPIREGAETIGMLELLSRAITPPDSELMLSLESIALQLGEIAQLLNLAASPHWRVGRM